MRIMFACIYWLAWIFSSEKKIKNPAHVVSGVHLEISSLNAGFPSWMLSED